MPNLTLIELFERLRDIDAVAVAVAATTGRQFVNNRLKSCTIVLI